MIKLENVKKVYKFGENEKVAIDNLNLEIQEGEMVAIIGPSGSGKTTLLNMIGCMDDLTEGKYYFKDVCVSDLNGAKLDKFRSENVAFIFQQFALMKYYTVYENIELPLKIKKVGKKERKAIIKSILEKLNIEDIANKNVTKISGGQQQRCGIGRALAVSGNIILADEPTGSLDINTGKDIMNIFKALNKENHTIVIVTHDINIAKQCSRIVRIEDGRIVEILENFLQ